MMGRSGKAILCHILPDRVHILEQRVGMRLRYRPNAETVQHSDNLSRTVGTTGTLVNLYVCGDSIAWL